MNSIELFAGAGGLALGLEAAGFTSLAAVERDDAACRTLLLNRPHWNVIQGDVRSVDFSAYAGVDLVAGGPPCQPFSLGGKAKGKEDERDMLLVMADVIARVKPKAFLMENVKGLTRPAFSDYFHHVLSLLSMAGTGGCPVYDVHWKVLNAADYGVPQKRERLMVVGFRRDLHVSWDFPKPTCGVWKTTRAAISDLPLAGTTQDPNHVPAKSFPKSYAGHTGSSLNEPAKTIKAGVHGVPGGENMLRLEDGTNRYFTVREAARIQTFPDSYIFSGSWGTAMRQVGNAVPVRLAEVMALSIRQALEAKSD